MEQKDIFISYSRIDEKSVSKIVTFLKREGFKVWIDKTGIETGEQFKNIIVDAILNCKIFIFVSSKASNASEWTEKEIGVAVSFHKKIIPIKLDNSPYNKSVLLDLVNLNYIDYEDVKHRKEQLEQLRQTIYQATSLERINDKQGENIKEQFSSLIDGRLATVKTKCAKFLHNYKWILILSCIFIFFICAASVIIIKTHTYQKKYIIPQQFGEVRDVKGNTIAKLDYCLYDLAIDPQIACGSSPWTTSDESKIAIMQLCKDLASLNSDENAQFYYERIIDGARCGRRYLPLLRNIDKEKLDSVNNWSIWEERWSLRRARIITEISSILYPYGVLANRTIGNGRVGILGQYLSEIEGKAGTKEMKILNIRNKEHHKVTSYLPPKDGVIVTSTLDMDMQELADKALRSNIISNPDIEGASLILMDVNSGAVLSMVNLTRSTDSTFRETYNHAIGHSFEPGTLFGGVSLAMYCSDNTILSMSPDKQDCDYYPQMPDLMHYYTHDSDLYKPTLKRIYTTKNNLTFREGIATANAYSMSNLVMRGHEGCLNKYIDGLKSIHLCDSIPLEIDGVRATRIGIPRYSEDYNAFLTTIGSGYGIDITAIQLHSFYNSIAKGKLVYPYLIESVSTRTGDTLFSHTENDIDMFSNRSIDTVSILDTLRSVMWSASQYVPFLKESKYKMGTVYGESLSVGPWEWDNHQKDRYYDNNGKSRRQAGCFCYFPYDEPKYSLFCVIFSRPTKEELLGRDLPCNVAGDLANMIYDKDKLYNNRYHRGR